MANVELRGLQKAFGTNIVLNGVDLSVHDGEFLVIVGPSGCGKSTLLRLIAGLEPPSSGDILIEGKSVLNDTPAQRGVAMVFQSYALYPHLNVFDNMAFGLRMSRLAERDIKIHVTRAATMLGIEDLLDRRPRELSGGQRQRVAIGRAIVRQPRLFLLDEPLSNLDAGLRVHMRHEFARLHRDLRSTMIYVTHDQVEAMTLADRIVVLNSGGVEQIGTPAQVYDAPRNLFVASFLGSPRMNLIAGEVIGVTPAGLRVKLVCGDEVTACVAPDRAAPGDKVTLGVRPEALSLGHADDDNRLNATVDVVETLGSAHAVYAMVPRAGPPVCAMLPPSDPLRPCPRVHDVVRLHFAPSQTYLFDSAGLAFTRTSRVLRAQNQRAVV